MLSSLNPFNRSQTPPPPLNYDMNKVFIIMKSPLLKKYEEIESIANSINIEKIGDFWIGAYSANPDETTGEKTISKLLMYVRPFDTLKTFDLSVKPQYLPIHLTKDQYGNTLGDLHSRNNMVGIESLRSLNKKYIFIEDVDITRLQNYPIGSNSIYTDLTKIISGGRVTKLGQFGRVLGRTGAKTLRTAANVGTLGMYGYTERKLSQPVGRGGKKTRKRKQKRRSTRK